MSLHSKCLCHTYCQIDSKATLNLNILAAENSKMTCWRSAQSCRNSDTALSASLTVPAWNSQVVLPFSYMPVCVCVCRVDDFIQHTMSSSLHVPRHLVRVSCSEREPVSEVRVSAVTYIDAVHITSWTSSAVDSVPLCECAEPSRPPESQLTAASSHPRAWRAWRAWRAVCGGACSFLFKT